MGLGSITSLIQVTNIAPVVTNEQLRTLFTMVGTVRDFIVYPTKDPSQQVSRVCYIRFVDPMCVRVAQHLTNTVFIDRAIMVKPVPDGRIPDETMALKLANEGHSQNSSNSGLVSQIETVNGVQSITTIDPRLSALGLPQYPPLPPSLDPTKIEEIRRTITVSNVNKQTTPEELLEFFNQFGEVKYLRMTTDENDVIKAAMIEYTDQSSVANALQNTGCSFHGSQLSIGHSTTSILKPQYKINVDPEKYHDLKVPRKSRSRSPYRHRSRSRESSRRRRRSRSPSRRSRERRRSPSGSRSPPRRRRSRSLERIRSPYSRRRSSRDRSYSKERRSRRDRSPDRDRRRTSRDRSLERHRSYDRERDHDRRRRDRSREKDYDRSIRDRSKERSSRRHSRSRESDRHKSEKHRSSRHKDSESVRRRTRSRSPENIKLMKSPIIHSKDRDEMILEKNMGIENNKIINDKPSIIIHDNNSKQNSDGDQCSQKSMDLESPGTETRNIMDDDDDNVGDGDDVDKSPLPSSFSKSHSQHQYQHHHHHSSSSAISSRHKHKHRLSGLSSSPSSSSKINCDSEDEKY